MSWMFLGTYFALSDLGGIEFRQPEPLPPGDSGLCSSLQRVLGAGVPVPSRCGAAQLELGFLLHQRVSSPRRCGLCSAFWGRAENPSGGLRAEGLG